LILDIKFVCFGRRFDMQNDRKDYILSWHLIFAYHCSNVQNSHGYFFNHVFLSHAALAALACLNLNRCGLSDDGFEKFSGNLNIQRPILTT